MARAFRPADYRPPLPLDRLIVAPGAGAEDERLEVDVLFVGGGPAGLSGAIELGQLLAREREAGGFSDEVSIGVLEKAGSLGEHCLSGAIVNPAPFRDLFPDLDESEYPLRGAVESESLLFLTGSRALRVPRPPTMDNEGNRVASICEIVRWLGERAEALGVDVFTGFPAGALLVDGDRVNGVRTVAAGLERDGSQGAGYVPPTDIVARVTALAEGSRGLLSQAYLEWQGIGSLNPQIYALGVKEVWETPNAPRGVLHTLGWPLPRDVFGGAWLYPMGENLLSLGLVAGLDHRHAGLDVHELLQRVKAHPALRGYFEGGELLEWGAKTIPEGGHWAIPERRHGDGVVILGDSAGFVDVASLKGIHHAMASGIHAARAIFEALKAGDTGAARLADYDRRVDASSIRADLHRTRNMRAAFKSGLVLGGARAWLMALTGGRFPGGRIGMHADADVERNGAVGTAGGTVPDGALSKVDAVFKSGNTTRDTIPSHLLAFEDVAPEVAEFYSHMCPAGVYETVDGKLQVNAPNCVDCKATDVLGPRWTPREGGAGPAYRRM
jgi:electron-transferring-flavoprotein dehydrogenase